MPDTVLQPLLARARQAGFATEALIFPSHRAATR
ncbi:MAG: hypothetical protein MUC79_06605 [Thiobacillaceae bacterium]|nr:hypothetical protein [Thiobacillaceae bacterium]